MSCASFRDRSPLPVGRFHLQVFRLGRLIEEVAEPNMVVIGAEAVLAALLAGAPGGGITQIGVGTSMVTPGFGNTALTAPFLKPIGTISQPVASQAVFAFSFGAAEANGISIGEFGLFTAAGTLFARKTRTTAPIPKDGTMALAGTWTIDFGVTT